tara:strand:+ start:1652 stop:2425 length:774 start_codon:yes stop_codon:yes gene_type:complete
MNVFTSICGDRWKIGMVLIFSIKKFSPNAIIHILTDSPNSNIDGVIQHKLESNSIVHKGGFCNSARFFIPSFVPQTVTKVLYLDADIIVTTDLSKLFSLNFSGNQWSAFVQESERGSSWYNRKWNKTKFVKPRGINAGVWLLNPHKMKNLSVFYKQKEYSYGDKIWDQHVLNEYFSIRKDEIYILPCMWNIRHNSRCSSSTGIHHGNNGVFEKPCATWWPSSRKFRKNVVSHLKPYKEIERFTRYISKKCYKLNLID